MPKTVDKPAVWIVCGTGPSFFDPAETFLAPIKILSLNRALCRLQHAHAAFWAHKRSWEAIEPYVERADAFYTGHKVANGGGDFLTAEKYPRYQKSAGDKAHILIQQYRMPRTLSEVVEDGLICGATTIAASALCWLRTLGVTSFYSCGLDGGQGAHKCFDEAYENVERNPSSENHRLTYNAIANTARTLQMEWIPVEAT